MQPLKPRPFTVPTALPTPEAAHAQNALRIVARRSAASAVDEAPASPALLAQRLPGLAETADATQIATTLVATWHALQGALVPVIGLRGVAALFKRSVQVTSAASPWLAGTDEGDQTPLDLVPLQVAVSREAADVAAATGEALLQAVRALLVSLVGSSLTASLLRRVWDAEPARPRLTPS